MIDKSNCTASTQKSIQDKSRKYYEEKKSYYGNSESVKEVLKFHLCDKTDHVSTLDFRGKKVIEYFACEKFANMTSKQRFELLKQKGLCRQCLNPGVKENTGFHKDSKCYSRFSYKNKHDGCTRKWHVLVCDSHKHEQKILALLKEYKKLNMSKIKSELPEYSKNIRIVFRNLNTDELTNEKSRIENTVFLLQTTY